MDQDTSWLTLGMRLRDAESAYLARKCGPPGALSAALAQYRRMLAEVRDRAGRELIGVALEDAVPEGSKVADTTDTGKGW